MKKREADLKDFWKLGVLVYLVAFNYPVIELFNRQSLVLGVPLAVCYLLGGWLLFILLVFLFCRRQRRIAEREPEEKGGER